MFSEFGVVEEYWNATRKYVTLEIPTIPMDVGRFAVTHKEEDLYVFKVPSLINITKTYPYFHDGSIWNLEDAIQIMAKVQLGEELKKDELKKIIAFLKALEGKIPEKALELPVLPSSTPFTPIPER
jgi:cytochrome c peroxidase